MKKRSKAAREPIKGQRRKTAEPERRNGRKAVHARSSTAGKETKVARLTRERDEALEHQTATSEVLQVISGSAGDPQPVFEAILAKAVRICDAHFGNIHRWDGNAFYLVATHNTPPALAEARRRSPLLASPQTAPGRLVATKTAVHITDLAADSNYIQARDPTYVTGVELGGIRTLLIVPMLKENELIGSFAVYRQEVRPFADKQIALVTNFAAQAVIAIENARLLNELRQRTTDLTERTADLTEALEQQTATSDVLKVISSSPGDLEPVFSTMLENAVRICGATFGNIYRRDGEVFRIVASHNAPPAFVEALMRYPNISGKRMLATKSPVHVADATTQPVYTEGRDPEAVAAVELGGVRTFAAVPMLKDDDVIGAFLLNRQEVRPFTDKQIELVQNFAAQAVIAIENARLLNELRERTTDLTERTAELTEALEQQTATSEVLSVVSSSLGELEAVFQSMLENAVRICQAKFGFMLRYDGEAYHTMAALCPVAAYADEMRRGPLRPDPTSALGIVATTRQVAQIPDITAHRLYRERDPVLVAGAELGGIRTIVAVPMLKDNQLIGAITIFRQEVRPFTEKQIALVQNFAAQAVIAIENARLLSELRERTTELTGRTADLTEALEQQTATSEVLQVISGSPGEVEQAFTAMLEKAVRICDAAFGNIFRLDGNSLQLVAGHNTPPAFADARRRLSLGPVPNGPMDRMIRTKAAVHIADLAAEELYIDQSYPALAAAVELGGIRTLLIVPLLKESEPIGAFALSRQEVRPFTEKQIALVTNFAAQAVIAIENARLLNELRQRTTDLTEALEQQTATSNVLQVISSSPGNLEPVFATMLENAVRLCDGKFGSINRWDGEALHLVATHNVPPAFAEFRSRNPFRPGPENPISRMLMTKTVIHFHDLAAEQGYIERDPTFVAAVELGGVRTFLAVPMLKENELIGVVIVYRQEVRAFSDKQVEIVKNFAAQAVIAIENARLLNELRQRTTDLSQRTTDLTEALEQQTATSEVLTVISSFPGDLQPVFDAMLANATRLCEATHGHVWTFDGEQMHAVAVRGNAQFVKWLRDHDPVRPIIGSAAERIVQGERFVHVADRRQEPAYRDDQTFRGLVDASGIRASLSVALRKGETLLGMINVYRQEVRPFTDKQIELVENFAAQAVIAIENARLLNELRQRTTDLSEALEQQTATSEVLQVISSFAGELDPVFQAMLQKAAGICDVTYGNIYRWDNGVFQLVATHNTPRAFVEARRRSPPRPNSKNLFGRIVATKTVLHIADFSAEQQEHFESGNPDQLAAVELGGVKTILIVPLLRENDLIGFFSLIRQQVKPFTDKQIELVTNFAAQAVIAIENARLLNELRETTEEVVKLNQHLEQRVTDQVGEIERMSRLRRFLPPQVADLIVASGTEKQLESHRREITALFCDLRGFTGFSESADPEDVMTLLREYHEALGASIIKYSGTLERYAGDGVMVVFNDPVPVENSALQAVLMALEMRDAIAALTETWRRWGHDIGFGIGIAHGFATLGTIGFEGRFDYAAIGTVSNVASRLCDEAKPGQILISPRVLTKVENAVKVEPVGEFELKGIRRPLAAYNVVASAS